MQVTQSIVIQRPVEEVFAFISNARNDPLWVASSQACEPDREPGVGQQRRSVVKMMGRERQVTSEVTEFEPGRRIGLRITSGMPMAMRVVLECHALEGATRVSPIFYVDLPLVLKPLSSLLAVMMRRQYRQDLLNLKRLLESPGSHP